MTVQIANTELNNNFNSWRLNTNLIATTIGNNTITVAKAGRGGFTRGSGHVSGNLTATTLATNTLRGGNTAGYRNLVVASNTHVNATFLSVTSNTTFQGNVIIATSGDEVFNQGDVSRIRMTGGTPGYFLRKTVLNKLQYKALSLRDIQNLSSNSAHFILSGANTTFSDNGDSTHLIFGSGSDRAHVYLAKDLTSGDSDLFVNLVDGDGDSRFVIADSSNTVVGYIDSDGNADFSGTLTADGATTLNGSVTLGDADTDTITVKGKFANQATTGTASFNGTTHFNGTTNMNGTLNLNGNVNVGDAAADVMTVTSTASMNGNTTIGNSTADTLAVNSRLTSHLIANGAYDLGSSSLEWRNLYLDGTAKVDTLTVDENATVAGTLGVTGAATFNGDMTLGDATADTITVKGNFANQHTEGLATFGDKVGIATGSVTAGYVFEADGKAYIHDDILAANNVVIHGDLQIDGSFTLPAGAAVSSSTGTFDDLTVTNDATIGNDATDVISITGATTITGDVDLNGELDVSDEIKNEGTTVISSNGKIHANNAITNGTIRDVHLENSGVTAGSYGGASAVPQITVDAKGLVTSISTATVAGVSGLTYTQSNNNIRISTATGTTYDDVIDAATTTSGTGRGVASFDSGDFSLSSGHVTLKNATTGAVLAINGTSNEVNVSRTNGTVTVGLPDDVTVSGQLNVGENVVISGNLTVSGTTTTVNTETVNIADNLIVLNSNYGGSSPTENGGIVIERGTQTNKQFIWNETRDLWEVDDDFQTEDQLLIQRNTGGVWRGISMYTSNTVSTNNSVISNNRNELKIESDSFVVKEYSGSEKYIECTDDGEVDLYYNGSKKLATASGGVSVTGSLTTSGDITVSGGDITLSGTGRIQGVDTVSAGTDATNKTYVDSVINTLTTSVNDRMQVANTNTLVNDRMQVANTQALVNARLGATASVELTGDISGSASFSGNSVSIATTYNNDVVLGTDTSGNYVATLTAGALIDLTNNSGEGASPTIDVDLSELTDMTADAVGTDELVILDDGNQRRKAINEITLGLFNTTNQIALGTDTTGNYMSGVTAGSGISVTHTPSEGSSATIAHSDTSSVSNLSVDGSGSSALQDISFTFDTFGHVTAASTTSANFLRADEADHKTSGTLYLDDGVDLAFGTDSDALVDYDATDNQVQFNMGTTTGIDFHVLGTSKITFNTSGDITVAGTLIESSDQRLKSDIQPITNAVDKVMALGGYTYNKEDNDTRRTGVIAQEVLEVLPEAVTQNEETGYYNVAYGNMVGLLIEAIKEQQKEIEELKKKLV